MDEHHYAEIDVALLYVEEARSRAEKAAEKLRSAGADEYLIEALDRARDQLSATQKELVQGTLFAVPTAQASL